MTADPLTEAELAELRGNLRYMNDLRHHPANRDEAMRRVIDEAPRLLATLDAERERTAALVEAALAIVDFFEGEAVFTQGTERESWSRMEAHHYVELQDHLLVDLEAALEARR